MHGLPQARMIGKRPAELWSPLRHRLVADRKTASGEDLVDMAEAERKANVGPHSVTDDLSRGQSPAERERTAVVIPAAYRSSRALAT
jgi:hypothetical protein